MLLEDGDEPGPMLQHPTGLEGDHSEASNVHTRRYDTNEHRKVSVSHFQMDMSEQRELQVLPHGIPRRVGRPVPSLWLDDPEALVSEARLWADLATPEEQRAYAAACFLEMTAAERRHVSRVLRQAVQK